MVGLPGSAGTNQGCCKRRNRSRRPAAELCESPLDCPREAGESLLIETGFQRFVRRDKIRARKISHYLGAFLLGGLLRGERPFGFALRCLFLLKSEVGGDNCQ